ncbi:MAG: hypothetical protein EP329_23890 [Deltaproteobacteria bacterium]|nr:MAG: hypothetical protein EP329_23890 [Deltaproteobacteria bacterium]
MSKARPVVPGAIVVLTRRCYERRFFLRPDSEITPALEYALAVALGRYAMKLVGVVFMSDHYHIVLWDPSGRYPDFARYLNSVVARMVNHRRGRWDRLWDGRQVHVEYLLTAEAVERKLVYVLCNPVAAGLVERGREWPGVRSTPQVYVTGARKVRRPAWFFDADGDMPEEAELAFVVPPTHADMTPQAFAALIAERVAEAEAAMRAAQAEAGRGFLGARGVLRQRWWDRARSSEERRVPVPVASGGGPRHREAVAALRLFRSEYAAALCAWRDGARGTRFPPGTWKMQRVHRARTHPPPGYLTVLAGFRPPPADVSAA